MSVHPLPSDGRADAAAAIEQLFRENHRVLVRFACQYVDSREAAEEVVQELFLHLWDRRERDAHVVLSRPYLFTAVRHRALNLLRHDRVRARRDDRVRRDIPDEVPSALDVALRRDLADRVRQAVARLSPKCRQVFLLSREGGLTYGEIAETLEISQKTVELHMTRALKALRVALSTIAPVALAVSLPALRDFFHR